MIVTYVSARECAYVHKNLGVCEQFRCADLTDHILTTLPECELVLVYISRYEYLKNVSEKKMCLHNNRDRPQNYNVKSQSQTQKLAYSMILLI